MPRFKKAMALNQSASKPPDLPPDKFRHLPTQSINGADLRRRTDGGDFAVAADNLAAPGGNSPLSDYPVGGCESRGVRRPT